MNGLLQALRCFRYGPRSGFRQLYYATWYRFVRWREDRAWVRSPDFAEYIRRGEEFAAKYEGLGLPDPVTPQLIADSHAGEAIRAALKPREDAFWAARS